MKRLLFAHCLLAIALAACQRPDESSIVALADSTLGLPPLTAPHTVLPLPAQIELGRKLFMDRRLSYNDTMSCAMCHVPEQGFTSNELATPIGFEGQSLRRNAPTILNVAYVRRLFHDGRESSLEKQAWGPLLAANEMANPSVDHVVSKIKALPDYQHLFESAFNGREVGRETIGTALASYERTLLSGNSRFDRWRYGQVKTAINDNEQAGFRIFSGKANCIACHSMDKNSALFTDGKFHNTGIGWLSSAENARMTYRVQLAPGLNVTMDARTLQSVSEAASNDAGRYEVTRNVVDRGSYRTPTLRNIALTSPYMHDGSLSALEQVVEFYDRGGIDNPDKDVLLQPLHLSSDEKRDLLAFLRTLTGENVKELGIQARAAAVGGGPTQSFRERAGDDPSGNRKP
ncbi:cytochrome-c peroxidase [Collimonas sp.]|jgi:cytochrome c peroxidase|uniref:cytochrome-c peroxidase n=1 Tax=Collimonas sp. TaxID=1963772 RepID=UPI002B83C142|nr:cytochrome c peroxidase [Collimonas sp.]HWX01364.1 cytochrome c peroxidase [Collimonas sp.]